MKKAIVLLLVTVFSLVILAEEKPIDRVNLPETRTQSGSSFLNSGSSTTSSPMSERTINYIKQYKVDSSGITQQPEGWMKLVPVLVYTILGFGLLTLIMVSVLLYKSDRNGSQALRTFGILTIIILSVVVVIVGYNEAQLTPIMGLFGAIAGYLLGKDSSNPKAVPPVDSVPQNKDER